MRNRNAVISDMSILTSIGASSDEVWERLYKNPSPNLTPRSGFLNREDAVPVGAVDREFSPVPSELAKYDCRNNRMAAYLVNQIKPTIEDRLDQYGSNRLGVVLGTSTSGIRSAEQAIDAWKKTGTVSDHFDYAQMEMGGLGEFVAQYSGITGPTLTISTSCSSSAKVFNTGKQYLEMDIVDAVVVGGVDTVSQLTLNGFDALQLVASEQSSPFSQNRTGINIGEGGALFVLERGDSGVHIMGVGESSDSYQMNAPDPEGNGARLSMERALNDAGCMESDIDYINLHGTGTIQNDAMESKAVNRVFGGSIPASSTKPFVGHTLGAAGAIEAAFCKMALDRSSSDTLALLPHLWVGDEDPDIASMNLVDRPREVEYEGSPTVLSNSFAFGGNNCSLVLGMDR